MSHVWNQSLKGRCKGQLHPVCPGKEQVPRERNRYCLALLALWPSPDGSSRDGCDEGGMI